MEPDHEEPPEGVQHYENKEALPQDIQKYWHQRRDLFSRYDEGIWLTENAWFGVTAEPVATKIAEDIGDSVAREKNVIIDCFAGVGGNAIAFALSGRWDRIFAIEQDPKTLKCAKHNAAIYGVSKKIFWIQGDCFQEVKKRFKNAEMERDAVVFGSPPWGGPDYVNQDVFDLNKMEPYSLNHLHQSFSKISKEIVLYLPKTSDLNQLARHAPEDAMLDVVHYNMNNYSKGVCAFFGKFDFDSSDSG
ncbi:MAG: hypothetical protein M1821_008723 [Bathelium mastoideum]|nr:MAG: hypothetical protein M1821_008723 [Bathelium mastoideum]KAI9685883.1 MAG: hypothetical protein M1822_004161 [Bathelium mastoideum]